MTRAALVALACVAPFAFSGPSEGADSAFGNMMETLGAVTAPGQQPGSNPVSSFFMNMGNPEGAGAHRAAAEGMQLLVRLWEQNGHDRQKAWIAFYQSPEGQRVVRTPGALKLLTEWFDAVMALPSRSQAGSHAPQVHAIPGTPPRSGDTQPAGQDRASVHGTLTPPFLGPYRQNVYGLGINSDATGRPFVWKPDQGPADPLAQVRPDAYGPGIGMDQYGRPVRPACPQSQQSC
jgi:hypothetical protein